MPTNRKQDIKHRKTMTALEDSSNAEDEIQISAIRVLEKRNCTDKI